MILYPLIAYLVAKLKFLQKMPLWAALICFIVLVVGYSYWFLAVNIEVYHNVALIAYSYYFGAAFAVFYLFSRRFSPVVTVSASFLFIFTLLRYWEAPLYVSWLFSAEQSLAYALQLLLWSIYGLSLMYLLLKPKTSRLKYIVIGYAVLAVLHLCFYNYLSGSVGWFGNEVYFMVGRFMGTLFLLLTFIHGERKKCLS